MIHFYRPTKRGTGFAASFWYSNRDNKVYATILKQSGWDEVKEVGIFKDSVNDPTKKVNIKLDFVEVGAILDCIERNREFKTYHDNDENPKNIAFVPWMQGETQSGFSFSIIVNSKQDTTQKNPFFIGFRFAEARLIREFLIFAMHRYFESAKTKNLTSAPLPKPEPKVEPKEEVPAPQTDPLTDF